MTVFVKNAWYGFSVGLGFWLAHAVLQFVGSLMARG